MTLTGVDVHGAKGPIDWTAVRASGRSFAFVKASEGKSFADARVKDNVRLGRAAGLHVGCYHFARPDAGNSPLDEAHHFLRQISGLNWDLPPVLDIERGAGALSQWALSFLGVVEAATATVPILYTYNYFAPNLSDRALARYPLWLAVYRTDTAKRPTSPKPWDHWTIWQHSSSGAVPGVPGRCDLNLCDQLPGLAAPPAVRSTLPAPTVTAFQEDAVHRIDIQIDTDDTGRGYRDIDVPPLDVINVMPNTGNPPDGGYKPIPDCARLDVGGKTRVVVEEAIPHGRIDLSVWVTG